MSLFIYFLCRWRIEENTVSVFSLVKCLAKTGRLSYKKLIRLLPCITSMSILTIHESNLNWIIGPWVNKNKNGLFLDLISFIWLPPEDEQKCLWLDDYLLDWRYSSSDILKRKTFHVLVVSLYGSHFG